MNLSKSRYTKGIQCPKMLWMDAHMPEEFDPSVMNQAVLDTGSAVGDLAMGYYDEPDGPHFVEVPFDPQDPERFRKAVARTQELLAAGAPIICEATFDFEGNYCMADILRVEDDGVRLVEVKSSTHVNEIYLHDMAFQAWVLQCCGMNVKSVSLMHLNRAYVRGDEVEPDLHKLFAVEDCTGVVMPMVGEVAARAAGIRAVAEADEEPDVPFGCQCKKPYPCGYHAWCWRGVPVPSVFDLNRMSVQKGLELAGQGVLTMPQVLAAHEATRAWRALDKAERTETPAPMPEVKLSPRQLVQAQAEAGLDGLGDTDRVDREAVAAFLNTLSFPLYFLDFETMQPAIPPYPGTHPYQQIPTQYSLHVLRAPDAPLEHYEYLAQPGEDPRPGVARALVRNIPLASQPGGTVLAYNMNFEKGRISELAAAFPELAEGLLAINDAMRDLIVPFQQGAYYARAMGGSNSIKAVLPALFPDYPELDYHALEGVHNGSEAMASFADMEHMGPEEAARTREQLLRYCKLDTYAMVRIWQKLSEM